MEKQQMINMDILRDSVSILDDLLDLCRELLSGQLDSDPNEYYEKVIANALEEVAKTVTQLSKHWILSNENIETLSCHEQSLYFWLGYESISRDNSGERLFIAEKGKGIRCHFSGDAITTNTEDHNQTSYWFDKLLAGKEDDFISGGTHSWILNNTGMILNNKSKSKFDILNISISDNPTVKSSVEGNSLRIYLKKDDCKEWGDEIANILNPPEVFGMEDIFENRDSHSQNKWPTPTSHVGDDGLQKIRRKIYNIWLAACFQPEWVEEKSWLKDSDFVDEVKSKNIKSLIKVLEIAGAKVTQHEKDKTEEIKFNDVYRYWYSLVINKAVTIDERFGRDFNLSSNLGTAMILSPYGIEEVFLQLLRTTIYNIYLMFRYKEASIMIRDLGRTNTLDDLSHEVLKLNDSLFDKRLVPISKIFEINGLENKRLLFDWHPTGALTVEKEDKDIISKWQICPNPELFEGLSDLLSIWGGSKNFINKVGSLKDTLLEAIIYRLVDISLKIGVSKEMRDCCVNDLEGIYKLKQEYDKKFNELKKRLDIQFFGPDLKLTSITKDSVRNNFNEFIRIFIAALSNTFEHCLQLKKENEDETYLIVNLKVNSEKSNKIFVTLKNWCPAKKLPKSNGTKAVLQNGLHRLNGKLESFYWESKVGKWITKFSLPTFVNEKGEPERWLESL